TWPSSASKIIAAKINDALRTILCVGLVGSNAPMKFAGLEISSCGAGGIGSRFPAPTRDATAMAKKPQSRFPSVNIVGSTATVRSFFMAAVCHSQRRQMPIAVKNGENGNKRWKNRQETVIKPSKTVASNLSLGLHAIFRIWPSVHNQ